MGQFVTFPIELLAFPNCAGEEPVYVGFPHDGGNARHGRRGRRFLPLCGRPSNPCVFDRARLLRNLRKSIKLQVKLWSAKCVCFVKRLGVRSAPCAQPFDETHNLADHDFS